jgi:hypothetical protein
VKVKTKRIMAKFDDFKLRGQANGNAVKGIARNAASVPAG